MLKNWLKKSPTAALGQELVACAAGARKLPGGIWGLEVDEEGLFTLYPPGEKLPAQARGGRRLWLHPGPYTLTFAPHPQTPEVGVEVVLQAQPEDERLARFLAGREGELFSLAELAELARQTAGPQLLQPAMSQAEIDATGGPRARFSNAMQAWGFRCQQMRRIDLADQVSTADQLLQQVQMPTPVVEETASARPREQDVAAVEQEQRQTLELAVDLGLDVHTPRIEPAYWRVMRLDERLRHNLQRDLPYLIGRLDAFGRALPRPEDLARLRDWQSALRRLQQRVAHLPVMDSRFPGLAVEAAERRRRVARLRRAARALRQLTQAVEALPEASGIDSRQHQDFLSLTQTMDNDLAHRAGLQPEEARP